MAIFQINISCPGFIVSPLPHKEELSLVQSLIKFRQQVSCTWNMLYYILYVFNSILVTFCGWEKCGWRNSESCVPTVDWYMLKEAQRWSRVSASTLPTLLLHRTEAMTPSGGDVMATRSATHINGTQWIIWNRCLKLWEPRAYPQLCLASQPISWHVYQLILLYHVKSLLGCRYDLQCQYNWKFTKEREMIFEFLNSEKHHLEVLLSLKGWVRKK